MDLGLRGKTALVSAGSKGIGLAIAKELAQEGCNVSICSRHQENLDAALPQISGNARGYVCDVSKEADLRKWVEASERELGPPTICIVNTGGPPAGKLDEMTDLQWQLGVESTLMNAVRLPRLVHGAMVEAGWGRVVHVTSLVAKEPEPILPISSTLRAGLMALVRLEAQNVARHGITVNAVLPGHTLTDRQRHLAALVAAEKGVSPEEALRERGEKVPVGRLADPTEIAAAAVFLCSQRASYITGVNLLVDGGLVKSFG